MQAKKIALMGHEYEVTPHPADEGWPLGAEILALGTEPLARLLKVWLSAEDELLDGLDAESVIAQVDWGSIGSDAAAALRLLAKSPSLVQRLFKYTWRDGKDLSVSSVFNEAYTANYKELVLAMKTIVVANGFLPFGD